MRYPLQLIPCLLALAGSAQENPIVMLGPVTMTDATVWVQCASDCNAYVAYSDSSDVKDVPHFVRTSTAAPNEAHVSIFHLTDLMPGHAYRYNVFSDSVGPTSTFQPRPYRFTTQPLWQWRTDPPDFTVALGSCAYVNEAAFDRPGNAYGGDYRIFNSIVDKSPELMLWLGDNVYLREADLDSRSGMLHRYGHTRSLPEMQRLLSSASNYAIWDDHDFGPNDGDRSFVLAATSREIFRLFWPNPTVEQDGVGGMGTQFSYGDVDFFLLDDRSFRTRSDLKTGPITLLGQPQIDRLIEGLKFSKAPFKVVAIGGQFLSTAAVYENYVNYAAERTSIIDRIQQEGIRGVLFVSGDRHFTELSELALPDGNMIRDLTVSPLTSTAYDPKEENTLRVEGTRVGRRNFATLTFSGKRDARSMLIRVFDSDGKQLWERSLAQ
ncbi:MAG: alkaline phosphatase D family protein [Flavobacteriales bacterium]